MRARDRRAVVGYDLYDQLDEFGGIIGQLLLNHSRPMTPPIPILLSRTSDSLLPAYSSSSPLSSDIVQMNGGLRIRPRRGLCCSQRV